VEGVKVNDAIVTLSAVFFSMYSLNDIRLWNFVNSSFLTRDIVIISLLFKVYLAKQEIELPKQEMELF